MTWGPSVVSLALPILENLRTIQAAQIARLRSFDDAMRFVEAGLVFERVRRSLAIWTSLVDAERARRRGKGRSRAAQRRRTRREERLR